MATKNELELGKQGEQLAVTYLEAEGMKIIERNWRCRHGFMQSVKLSQLEVFQLKLDATGRQRGRPSEASDGILDRGRCRLVEPVAAEAKRV